MRMKVSETFDMTMVSFNDKFTDEEYAILLKKHIANNLPGKPSIYRYRQIVSMGGSRSSKSYSILQLLLIQLMVRKNIKITVWRNTKVTCRGTIMEDFQKIIMFDEYIYNNIKENKQLATFIYKLTGSKIVFEGADNISKVLGSEQTISFFNEVTEFNYEVYLQITQRTSDRVIDDYNPSKDFWLEKYRNDEDTVFIHSTFENNAFCPVNIIKQLLSYEPWERNSYEVINSEVYYNNKIVSAINQPPPNLENIRKGTANEYMWLVYGLGIGAEKPNKIYHGWTKITEEYYNSINSTEYFGIDFGTAHPTACVGIKYDGNGAFYINPALYKPIQNLEDGLPTILKLLVPQLKKNTSMLIGDPAKDTYINILLEAGYFILKAVKGGGSVESGISTVQSFKIFYVYNDDLDNEYSTYSWQIDRYGKPTEVPVKKDDHYMDAIRYTITYLCSYLGIKL